MKKVNATSQRNRPAARRPKRPGPVAAPLPAADDGALPRQNLAGIFGVDNIEKVFGLCNQVLDRRWSVSDVGVPYQWINYWDREHLLMDIEREGSSWRKFSFIDYVWIRMVCEMRSFGLSFPSIRKVKETLAAPLPVESEIALRKTRERSSYNILLLLIAEAAFTKAPIHLLVRSDGETLLFNESHVGLYGPELAAFQTVPHLRVPLTGMLGEIVQRNHLDFIAPNIPLLTAPEVEVLKHLREGQLTRLEAESAGGESTPIITAADYDPVGTERALLERIMLQPYAQIRYETRDGKTVAFRSIAKGGEP